MARMLGVRFVMQGHRTSTARSAMVFRLAPGVTKVTQNVTDITPAHEEYVHNPAQKARLANYYRWYVFPSPAVDD